MQEKYNRQITGEILEKLEINPVAALLGPRQCGKTTLAKLVASNFEEFVLLDLERRMDLEVLQEPELFLERHVDKLIIIDEIQLRPDLFGIIRSHVDKFDRNCKILILGSASRELVKQGAESLAGRVSFIELTPFLISELSMFSYMKFWERGGFPLSILADDDRKSLLWREDYLKAIVERDLPLLGLVEPPLLLKRFLSMLGHFHGETINMAKMGESLGINTKKIPDYIAFLEGTFMVRVLQPYHSNLKKRLVKSPKVYFRDTGILQTVLGITSFDELMGNPVYGNSWEGFVIEQILGNIDSHWDPFFYRTQVGAEIDLILERGDKKIAIECKASKAPSVSRGFWNCLEDLNIPTENSYIVAPVDERIPYKNGTWISGIEQIIEYINKL